MRRKKRSWEEIQRRKSVAAAKRLLGKTVNYVESRAFILMNQKTPIDGSTVVAIDTDGKCRVISRCCDHDFGWWSSQSLKESGKSE